MNETLTASGLNREIIQAFHGIELSGDPDLRKEAIALFNDIGFPGKKSEEYRFTPITRVLEKNFLASDFVKSSVSSVASVEPYLIPSYPCNLIVFVNGCYNEKLSKILSPEEQITVKPLARALTEQPQITRPYFGKLVDPAVDPFSALNASYWQSGIFIHVPRNIKVETPVFILHLHDTSAGNVVSQTRVLALLEEGSELNMIEKFDSVGTHSIFGSVVEEIEVGTNASLNYYKIQHDSGLVYQVANTCIHQKDASRVNTFTLTLDGQLIRNNHRIIIDGEKCESHFYGLYLLHKNSLVDNHTVVDHQKPNSFSNELYKGIMDDHSKGVFNGKIYVRPHAQKTNAFQSNRNILLTDTSTINTKPQLEIWADDVKCSHGCTSGQLDEEALFYLQSRGISKPVAQAMLLYAFAGEVIDPIKDLLLKSYLDTLVSARLQRNS